jgi:DNA-binding NarL/FixJ family response regulator
MIDQSHSPQPPADWPLLSGRDQRLRVLIADHDGLARRMTRTALSEEDRRPIVLAAGDGREALELARYYRPGVVVIDTALPPYGGVEVIKQVLQMAPETRIVSISVGKQGGLAALRAGAVGHIDKDVDPDELARLVMRAADGEAIVPQRLMMPLLELVRAIPDVGWRPLQSRLTTREWEIVELLGERASTAHIAEQFVLSHTTVYSHIKSIMRKLDVRSRHDVFGAAEHLRRQEVIGEKTPILN